MASPFSVFRRNQRAMLAIFGVLLMIAFVLSGSLSGLSSNRTPQNPVAVRTNYGAVHENELQNMVQMRRVVMGFIQQLVRMRVEQLATKGELSSEQEKAFWTNFYVEQIAREYLQRFHQQQEEAAAIETMILDRRASELGVAVSDAAVNEFIRTITDNLVSSRDVEDAIASIKYGGGTVSPRRLMDALRAELQASYYLQMFATSLGPLPPGERWDYYSRIKRQVNAEVMAVPVKNFVDEVSEPSESELKEFFDKYKYSYTAPESPTPGFKKPPRWQFQYFKATYTNFLDQVEVTDKEIEEYYKDHKEQFRKSQLPDDSAADLPGSTGTDAPSTDAPGTETEAEKPAESSPDSGSASPDKVEDAKPADENAAEPAPESSSTDAKATDNTAAKPADATPAAKQPAAKAPEAKQPAANKPAANKQSSRSAGTVKLVAATSDVLLAQADDQPAANADQAGGDAAQSDAKAADPEKGDGADSNSSQTPADAGKTDGAQTEDAKPDDAGTGDTKTDDAKQDDEEEYEPLDKVRDQIRRELASRAAGRKIDAILDELAGEMRDYADQRVLENRKDFQPFNVEAAAKRHGLDAFETGLLSPVQLSKTDLGKAQILDEIGRARTTVIQRAFSKDIQDFQPATANDLEGNRYLYWRIKHEEEEVPALDDVRKQVVQAWKLVQARDIAKKKAEELAADARNKKQSLSEVFGPEQVRETGKFSWLTLGSTGNAEVPQVSEVPGVETPGNTFMESVHYLELGEIGVAMNQPQAIAYVVRISEVDLPTDAFEDFAKADTKLYAAVARAEQDFTFRTWFRNLEESVGLHWEREPRANQAF